MNSDEDNKFEGMSYDEKMNEIRRALEEERGQYDSEKQSQYNPGQTDDKQWYEEFIRDLDRDIKRDKKVEQYLLGHITDQLGGTNPRKIDRRNEEEEDYIDVEYTDVTDSSEEPDTSENQEKALKSDKGSKGKDPENMTHQEKSNKITDLLEQEKAENSGYEQEKDYSEMSHEKKRKLIGDHLQNYFNEFVDEEFNFGDLREELRYGEPYQNNEERKNFYNFVDEDIDLEEAKERSDFYDFVDEDLDMSEFKDILND